MKGNTRSIDCDGKPYNRFFLVTVLLVGTFCVVANHTAITTALPGIMRDFHIDADTGQWLTSGFLLMNGIMIPVTGMLMHRISSKKLYMAAMLIFLSGTLLAVSAPNFPALLIGRLIQAVATGIMIPLMQTILLLVFPKKKRGMAMGLDGLVLASARVIGPTGAGLIIDHFNWRILFCTFIPFALLAAFLAPTAMRKIVPLERKSIDFVSLALSTLGFGGLLYGFSSVGHHGWSSPVVITGLTIGAISLIGFIYRELTIDNPMLNLRVFRSPLFSLSVVVGGTLMVVMFGGELVLPLYIQNVRGGSAFFSGLVMLPGAVVMGLMSPLSGIIFDKIGIRKLAVTGMGLLTLGTIPFVFLTMSTQLGTIIVLYAVRFLGISMVMMPMTTAGMNTLPDTLMSDGTAVTNTIRTIIGSIGTAILISVMSDVTKNELPEKSMYGSDPALFHLLKTDAALSGVNAAFLVAIGFCVLTWALTFFINENRHIARSTR
ncbi:DHA2 family efflux MFS transporter permease subunit [Sporolactobacillus shoreicorticis]|uniref:MDR family MFS transporter n=1 Tax=Sporolactobacillus shoreicorticis TaxID=1923877 RepID=A0ABW5S164_9BACL|nr:MDR family MFS transporter [Sporolactobacillus shoreicorticis]MCO7127223.1 DHA2 family efflux MFS transporter permease subunit [Sporolactobacillus shoreicorticis]